MAGFPTYAGGHLGAVVAPLVDGQLRAATAERAWAHVLRCPTCTDAVRRQTWVKNQLLLTGPVSAPASLADRLCSLPDSLGGEEPGQPAAERGWSAWSPRSRAAVVAGAGGLSAAAFVVASLVGLPAVEGPVPVQARLGSPSASPGGPGAVVFDVVDRERQRRIGLP